MATTNEFRLTLGESTKEVLPPKQKERRVTPRAPKLNLDPRSIARALKATAGFKEVAGVAPKIADWHLWFPVATFSVCVKTGTASWLDIWDNDHFDGFTDMQRCLSDCRVWFSDQGYAFSNHPDEDGSDQLLLPSSDERQLPVQCPAPELRRTGTGAMPDRQLQFRAFGVQRHDPAAAHARAVGGWSQLPHPSGLRLLLLRRHDDLEGVSWSCAAFQIAFNSRSEVAIQVGDVVGQHAFD